MLRRRTAGVLVLLLALACGCSASPDTRGPLPDGTTMVHDAATALEQLHSIEFDFSVSGTIPGLDVREVKGQASRDGGRYGTAVGQADMQESTNRFELQYEIDGDTLRLTDQHGTRTDEPVPAEYNIVALLDPQHGVPSLLRAATGLKTETKEDVQGVETYRVTGQVAKSVVSGLLPGITSDVDVKFWVTQSQPQTLVRVWMQVPPRQPNEGAVMLELGLSHANAPISSTAAG